MRCASRLEADKVEGILEDITGHVRDIVANDNVTFDIEISDADIPKNLWTDDRVLEDLVQQHPAIEEMIKKFQLRRI